jgi:hypothetical protein
MKAIGTTAAALTLGSAALAAWAAAPRSQYAIRQDGTVFDNKTGLTWQREAQPPRDLKKAKDYCASLNLSKFGGFSTGWRLPERLELESLVDPRIAPPGPTIDQFAFPETPNESFWTVTPDANGSGDAWYIYFGSGVSDVEGDSFPAYWVRCVR